MGWGIDATSSTNLPLFFMWCLATGKWPRRGVYVVLGRCIAISPSLCRECICSVIPAYYAESGGVRGVGGALKPPFTQRKQHNVRRRKSMPRVFPPLLRFACNLRKVGRCPNSPHVVRTFFCKNMLFVLCFEPLPVTLSTHQFTLSVGVERARGILWRPVSHVFAAEAFAPTAKPL